MNPKNTKRLFYLLGFWLLALIPMAFVGIGVIIYLIYQLISNYF